MTSAMNAVVTVKSIKVLGDSKEYPADEVTMKPTCVISFGKAPDRPRAATPWTSWAYTITEGETARVAPELPLALVWPSGGGETA